MEKIKYHTDIRKQIVEVSTAVNQIIDWVNEPDDVEDRLKTLEDKMNELTYLRPFDISNTIKTLEDKVKFIMDKSIIKHGDLRDWSLQDLWDEEEIKEGHLASVKAYVKEPTAKEYVCICADCEPTVKECDNPCEHSYTTKSDYCVVCGDLRKPTDNSEKIEEDIPGFEGTIAALDKIAEKYCPSFEMPKPPVNKAEKIEEIFSEFMEKINETFWEVPAVFRTQRKSKFESWLRDKLKEL